jgi:hypothetical protein
MHLRALLVLTIAALAVLPLACTTKDENPDWSPGTDYPDWAYNAPVYLQPAEELQPQAKVGNNIPVYYTRDNLFFVKHPQGKQQDVYPHVAVWGSDSAGRKWKKAGYFGLDQTHFLYKADHDGGYWVRFVGPGQGVTEVPPGQPHRIYVIDTHAPDISMELDPVAWYCPEHCGCPSEKKDDCGEQQPGQPEGKPCNPRCENARPHIYRVGDEVTLHWSVSDANLKKKTIKLSTCFATFPHNLVWSEFPEALPTSGSIKITIPPEAAHQAGLRFRIVAEDLAGNIGIQMTDVMHVRGREGMPLKDQLAKAPSAYQPTDRSPDPARRSADSALTRADHDLPDPDSWSPDPSRTATEPTPAQPAGDEPGGSQLASGPARDAVPASTPPHATPSAVEPEAAVEPAPAEASDRSQARKPMDLPDAGRFDQPAPHPKDRSEELLEPVELQGKPTEVEPLPEPAVTQADEPTAVQPAPHPVPAAEPVQARPDRPTEDGSIRITGKNPIDPGAPAKADAAPAEAAPTVTDQPDPVLAETPRPGPGEPEPTGFKAQPAQSAQSPEPKPTPAPALPEMHEQRRRKELDKKLGRADEPAEQVNPAISVIDSKARTDRPEPTPEPKDTTGPRIVLDADAEAASQPAAISEGDSKETTKLSELVQPGQEEVEPVLEAAPTETPVEAEQVTDQARTAKPETTENTVSVLDLVETRPAEEPAARTARTSRTTPPTSPPADVPVLTEADPKPIVTEPDTAPESKKPLSQARVGEPTDDQPAPATTDAKPGGDELASAADPAHQPEKKPAPPAPDQPISDRVDWISPDGKADTTPTKPAGAKPSQPRPTETKTRPGKPKTGSLVKKKDRWGKSPIVRKAPRSQPAVRVEPKPQSATTPERVVASEPEAVLEPDPPAEPAQARQDDQPQLARRSEPQRFPGTQDQPDKVAKDESTDESATASDDASARSLDDLLEEVKAEDQAVQARPDSLPARPKIKPTPSPERSYRSDIAAETDGDGTPETRPEPDDVFLSPAKAQPVEPEHAASGLDKPATRLSDIPEKVQQGWPVRGMVFRGGVSRLLNWLPGEAGNYRMVKLQFSANDGAKWMTVAEGLRDNQAVMWTVPVVTSNHSRLRIVAMDPKGKEIVLETSPRFTVDTGAWKTVDMSGFNPQIQEGSDRNGN